MKRFYKVLRKDIQDSLRSVLSQTAIFIGIYLLLWVLFTFVFGSGATVTERKDYFWMLAAIFGALIPGTVYGYVTDDRGSVEYFLLPASRLEKYTVMILCSVFLYPAAYLLIQAGADSLLASIGSAGWGYRGFIWSEFIGAPDKYLMLIILSSMFMVGNLLFRNRKVGKTLLLAVSFYLLWCLVKRYASGAFPMEYARKAMLWVSPPLLWLVGYRKTFATALRRHRLTVTRR